MSTLGGHGVRLERDKVTDINRSNQVFRISTNVGSKTNQIKAMVPDYGTVWYDYKAISDILLLTNFSINTESPMTHTKIMLLLFTPIGG